MSETNADSIDQPKVVFDVDDENEDQLDAQPSSQSGAQSATPAAASNNSTTDSPDAPDVDLSKYTVIDADNLDEDKPIAGQEFALFSFMSPEGIMNCNIRLLKFRGAFPDKQKAQAYADELKKTDKYFKILCAESGKWVEFDPPEDHVEEVVAGNKKQQKIVDAQRKARMDKANELAGRHKQKIDKSDRGAQTRIEESKKAGVAEGMSSKKSQTQSNSAQSKSNAKQTQQAQPQQAKSSKSEAMRKRLQKKLADKQAKSDAANLEKTREVPIEQAKEEVRHEVKKTNENANANTDKAALNAKTQTVYKASDELDQKKAELEKTNANIEKIRRMMKK